MSYRIGILASHPIQYYAPWFRHLAGRIDVEVFYAHRQDAQGQAEAGFDVAFDWDVPLLEGYPHRWLENVASRPGLDSFWGCDTPEIYDILERESFDALLIFGWHYKSYLQAAHACQRSGVAVFMRGDSQLCTPRSRLKSLAKYVPYRWLLPQIDAHLYVGERNRAYLQHYGVPDDQLFFVPHFVDNAFFAERAEAAVSEGTPQTLREELGIPPAAFVFLFVGKFIPKKRPADVIRAVQRVAQATSEAVHVILVGNGPLQEALRQQVRSDVECVHFAGFRNQTELPAFYATADALVLPSDGRETWGLVVNEAMACGTPAIVSDAAGCAPDLIDEGKTGYAYPMGAVDALADRMKKLMACCRQRPEVLRRALAEKSACYSMEHATDGLLQALHPVTA